LGGKEAYYEEEGSFFAHRRSIANGCKASQSRENGVVT
jgi:hypothetical protein